MVCGAQQRGVAARDIETLYRLLLVFLQRRDQRRVDLNRRDDASGLDAVRIDAAASPCSYSAPTVPSILYRCCCCCCDLTRVSFCLFFYCIDADHPLHTPTAIDCRVVEAVPKSGARCLHSHGSLLCHCQVELAAHFGKASCTATFLVSL